MPRYIYKCSECGKTKQVDQRTTDEHSEWCDESGDCGVEMVLQIGNTSFVTKGSGWFNTGGY